LSHFGTIIFICILSFFSNSALAVLGEDSSRVEQDRASMSAKSLTKTVKTNFNVHEILNDGVRIREYEDSKGKIFAITWQAVTHPDLSNLLGKYLGEYQNAVINKPKQKGQRRFGSFKSNNLIVEKSGVLGKSRGRAYLPAALPKGVDINEIE